MWKGMKERVGKDVEGRGRGEGREGMGGEEEGEEEEMREGEEERERERKWSKRGILFVIARTVHWCVFI
jgi:hypothetical protein